MGGIFMKKEVKFQNYFGSLNRTITFELTNYYCPNCGKKEVWTDNGPGDYYEGPTFLCTNCQNAFTLPSLRKAEASLLEVYIIEELNKSK